MPDETKEAKTLPTEYDVNASNVQTTFAMDSLILVDDSAVNVFFSDGTINESNKKIRPNVRVAMSHSMFVGFMRYAQTRLEFIEKAYGDNPMGLNDIRKRDPELFDSLVKNYVNPGTEPKKQPKQRAPRVSSRSQLG